MTAEQIWTRLKPLAEDANVGLASVYNQPDPDGLTRGIAVTLHETLEALEPEVPELAGYLDKIRDVRARSPWAGRRVHLTLER